jgi:hypothetical protein
MPTLKLATLCEKVIIDSNAVPSLIGLFSEFKISVPQGTTLPSNAAAPKEWSIFCIWECSPDEVGQEFHQIIEVNAPEGTLFSPPATIKFTPLHDRLRQNVVGNSLGVPIGREGPISVTIRLELNGQTVVPPITLSFKLTYVPA